MTLKQENEAFKSTVASLAAKLKRREARVGKLEAALDACLKVLSDIRYTTWPTEGLGIGLSVIDLDEALVNGEAVLPGPPKPASKKKKAETPDTVLRTFLGIPVTIRDRDLLFKAALHGGGRVRSHTDPAVVSLVERGFIVTCHWHWLLPWPGDGREHPGCDVGPGIKLTDVGKKVVEILGGTIGRMPTPLELESP